MFWQPALLLALNLNTVKYHQKFHVTLLSKTPAGIGISDCSLLLRV